MRDALREKERRKGAVRLPKILVLTSAPPLKRALGTDASHVRPPTRTVKLPSPATATLNPRGRGAGCRALFSSGCVPHAVPAQASIPRASITTGSPRLVGISRRGHESADGV